MELIFFFFCLLCCRLTRVQVCFRWLNIAKIYNKKNNDDACIALNPSIGPGFLLFTFHHIMTDCSSKGYDHRLQKCDVNSHSFDYRPQDYQHFFSAWVLGSVLKRASQKRRSLRDDRLSDREKRDDPSRCDSANSEVPPTRLTTHGSSLGGEFGKVRTNYDNNQSLNDQSRKCTMRESKIFHLKITQ